MYSTYVLRLVKKRFYIGMAPTWRLETRLAEHFDPNHPGAKWTQKYKPIKVLKTRNYASKKLCEVAENKLTRQFMSKYGVDSTRGGQYVMTGEGADWWVPNELKGYPRLICEHSFAAF